MTLVSRRTCSWIVSSVLVVGLAAAYARLPGAGGLAAELRWLLRDGATNPPPRVANCVATRALFRCPKRLAAALRELLRDEDAGVRRGTILLWMDLMRIREARANLSGSEMAEAFVGANKQLPPALRVPGEPQDGSGWWSDENPAGQRKERLRESRRAASQPGKRDG